MRRSILRWGMTTLVALAPSLVWADDQAIAQRIAQDLRNSGVLVDYSIGVKYEAGTAMLLGRVANDQQLRAAVEMARQMADVNHVISQLEVKSTQPQVAQASATSKTTAKPVMRLPFISSNPAPVTNVILDGQPIDAPPRPQDPLSTLNPPKFSIGGGNRSEQAAAQRMAELASQSEAQHDKSLQLTGYADSSGSDNKQRPVKFATKAATAQLTTTGHDAPPTTIAAPSKSAARPMAARPVSASTVGRGTFSPASATSGIPLTTVSNSRVAALPAGAGGANYASYGGGVHDQPQMPSHAWPSYASYPNYAGVTYPKQYSPSAWPYIGPFYPYPQVPLGWRRVTLEWDDGWWYLDFDAKREASRKRWHPNR